MKLRELVRLSRREREREGVNESWGYLVYKLSSIIGGGSFVRQRGQRVVGTLSLSL